MYVVLIISWVTRKIFKRDKFIYKHLKRNVSDLLGRKEFIIFTLYTSLVRLTNVQDLIVTDLITPKWHIISYYVEIVDTDYLKTRIVNLQ